MTFPSDEEIFSEMNRLEKSLSFGKQQEEAQIEERLKIVADTMLSAPVGMIKLVAADMATRAHIHNQVSGTQELEEDAGKIILKWLDRTSDVVNSHLEKRVNSNEPPLTVGASVVSEILKIIQEMIEASNAQLEITKNSCIRWTGIED